LTSRHEARYNPLSGDGGTTRIASPDAIDPLGVIPDLLSCVVSRFIGALVDEDTAASGGRRT